MGQEQRQYPRVAKPIEATWHGASGGWTCRIADLSWGGCFIQTPAEPGIGEQTVVTASIGGRSITLSGAVVYLEKPMGFAMKFDALTSDQIDVLKDVLGDPPTK